MTSRRRTSAFLAAALFACASCGGDDDAADDAEPAPPPAPAAVPRPSGKAVAWIASRSAGATLTRDGLDTPLEVDAAVGTGDVVRLPADGRADLEFDDGGGLWLVGPAGFSVGEMSAKGRRVMFGSGSISRAKAGKVAVEIQTPRGVNLVLQNCVATASIDKSGRVEFRRLGPGLAKVWHETENRFEDLGDAAFVLEAKK